MRTRATGLGTRPAPCGVVVVANKAGECQNVFLRNMNIHEEIERHFTREPRIHPSAFLAPNAVVTGDVALGEEVSVWYGAVLRGDINSIVVGAHSNVQDGAVVHLDSRYGTTSGKVGNGGTPRHRACLHDRR